MKKEAATPKQSALEKQEAARRKQEEKVLVRIHLIIVMIRWTGLAPWEFEFPFPGSLIHTFLVYLPREAGGRPPQAGGEGAHPQLLQRNVQRFRGGLVFKAHRLVYHATLGLRVIQRERGARPGRGCTRDACASAGARDTGSRAPHAGGERLVFYCRTTSANTAPRTPRRTCCPYAYELITVLRVSRSCKIPPDGFDLHLLQAGGEGRCAAALSQPLPSGEGATCKG